MIGLLVVGVGVTVDALVAWLPARVRDWRLGAGTFRASPATIGIALLPLLPSLFMLPAILQLPSPSGKAQAQAWFAQALETPYGQEHLDKRQSPTLKIAAEAYTVYLDPEVYEAKYYSTITKESGLPAFRAQGYDMVILGSGMYHRFYDNPDVYPRQVRIYDQFFDGVPDYVAFEKRYDPLAFRKGGSQVYVFFLTEQAKKLKWEVANR